MSQRNCSSDDAERTDGGRAFHARAAATSNKSSASAEIGDRGEAKLTNFVNSWLNYLTSGKPSK